MKNMPLGQVVNGVAWKGEREGVGARGGRSDGSGRSGPNPALAGVGGALH